MCHSVKYQLCYRLQYNTKDYDIVGIAVFLYLLDFKKLNNVFSYQKRKFWPKHALF